MEKLLNKALNTYQSTGSIPPALIQKIKAYDRKHSMWACMANDEMREAWELVTTIGNGAI